MVAHSIAVVQYTSSIGYPQRGKMILARLLLVAL